MQTKTKKLIIVGAGEFAEIAYEYFTHDSAYEVVAFAVEEKYISSKTLFDLPVLALESLTEHYPPSKFDVFVAVTMTKLNRVRRRLFELVKAKGYRCATYVSSKAFVWHNVELGENCFIFENNVIQYHAKIGHNVIMWSGNHMGHRAVIGDHCFVSSHVVISGYTQIGEHCFLGVNSTLVDKIKVGADNFIGAGALITKDTLDNTLYPGMPTAPSKISALKFFKVDA